MFNLVPLKYVAHCNPEIVPEDTDPQWEIQYVDIGNVTASGSVTAEAMLFGEAPSRARRRARPCDVIVSTVRTYLRAIAHLEAVPTNLVVSTGFAVLRPNETVNSRFFGYALQSNDFVGHVVSRSEGVSYPAIAPNKLGRIRIPLPRVDLQASIADFLDDQTALADALIANFEKLGGLLNEKRISLVTRVMTNGLDPSAPTRDVGVSSIKLIPKHWQFAPLKRLVADGSGAIKAGPFGSQLLTSEMTEGSYRVYTQRNVIDGDAYSGYTRVNEATFKRLEAFSVYTGDVLVTTRGTIGKGLVLPRDCEPGILHPCLMRVQCNPNKLLPEYLCRMLQDCAFVQQQFKVLSNATTIDVIYSSTLKDLMVPVPPINEQHDILAHIARSERSMLLTSEDNARATALLSERRAALITAAVAGSLDVKAYTARPEVA